MRARFATLLLVLLATACQSLEYDLSSVPVPISAKPAPASAQAEPFTIESKDVLWVHGLFGQSSPDVAALVAERAKGYDRIAGFRVRMSSGVHEWLITHLTLTLIRMKTVVIEGQLVRGR